MFLIKYILRGENKMKDKKKSLMQRLAEVDVLGDGNLVNVKPSDVLIKSFEDYDESSNEIDMQDDKETENEKNK